MGKQLVEVTVERARVTLVGAQTHKLGGKKFIKDLPKIIKGKEAIQVYKKDGYFSVSDLEPKIKKVEASTVKKKKSNKKASGSKKSGDKNKKGKKKLLKK